MGENGHGELGDPSPQSHLRPQTYIESSTDGAPLEHSRLRLKRASEPPWAPKIPSKLAPEHPDGPQGHPQAPAWGAMPQPLISPMGSSLSPASYRYRGICTYIARYRCWHHHGQHHRSQTQFANHQCRTFVPRVRTTNHQYPINYHKLQ